MLHDESRHRTNRSQIHLQKQGLVAGAPLVDRASRDAAVHSLLRPLIRAARHTSSGGLVEREVHAVYPNALTPFLRVVWPVNLELVNPGHRLPAIGRTSDVQADETSVDRRLDHVGRRPRIPGALPDAPAPCRPGFPGRCSQPLLDLLGLVSLLDAIHQGRADHAVPGKPLAPELRLETVPEEDHRWQDRQPINPERAPGEEDAPKLDLRNRPGLPGPTGQGTQGGTPPGRSGRRSHDSPPIRYSYNASTFSSAGTTLSILWPSSAIRPSARANCSRSRVITNRPSSSSFNLISVMCSSANSSAATPDASRARHRMMYWLGCSWISSRTSRIFPSATIIPLAISTTWSLIRSTSCRTWLERITCFRSAAQVRNRSIVSARTSGSRPFNGSSSTTTSGS